MGFNSGFKGLNVSVRGQSLQIGHSAVAVLLLVRHVCNADGITVQLQAVVGVGFVSRKA